MANITYFISASHIGAGLEDSNFLLFHTECNNPDNQITYSGSNIIPSSSLAEGLTLTLDSSITTLHLYPISEGCPLGCGYNYSINLGIPPSPTPSLSVTPSTTPSITATPGISSTPSPSVVIEETPPPSVTPSISVTPAISNTPGDSPTPTPSNTPSISVTPSRTPSTSATPSISVTPSRTPSTSATPSISITPSITKTPPSSATPSVTPSRSLPTVGCTEYAFTAINGTMVFQYYNCLGEARSVTVYSGFPIRRCVLEGTTPIAYPDNPGAYPTPTGIAEDLGSVCTYVDE